MRGEEKAAIEAVLSREMRQNREEEGERGKMEAHYAFMRVSHFREKITRLVIAMVRHSTAQESISLLFHHRAILTCPWKSLCKARRIALRV